MLTPIAAEVSLLIDSRRGARSYPPYISAIFVDLGRHRLCLHRLRALDVIDHALHFQTRPPAQLRGRSLGIPHRVEFLVRGLGIAPIALDARTIQQDDGDPFG